MNTSQETNQNQIHRPFNVPQGREVTDDQINDNEERRKRFVYAPNPLCNVCNGFGFVHPLDSRGLPIDGEIVPCTAENCLADAKRHYKMSGEYLIIKGVSARLQTFKMFIPRDGTGKSFEAFKALAEGTTTKRLLLCYGGNGGGKTHLGQALTTELNRRGIDCRFYTVPGLMRSLKNSMQDNTLDKWLNVLGKVEGLVLDDFGMEYGTNWELTQLEDIINQRWQDKSITVVTSNKDLLDIQRISPRIYSRMCDTELSAVVANTATDYRLIKRHF
jgi:DNA replication protein DnaC